MRRNRLAVLVSLSMLGTMAVSGYAVNAEEKTTEEVSSEVETEESEDQKAADQVADLIDAIYVQERNEDTDKQ